MSPAPPLRRPLTHLRPLRLDEATSRSALARGTLSTVGLASQGALRLSISLLTGRVLGKVVLGTLQSAISAATLLSLLWPTTTGAAASKYVARARGAADGVQLQAVANHLRRRTILATVLISCGAVPLWMSIGDATVLDSLPVAAFTAAYSGYSFTRGIQFGAGQVPRATTWDLVSASAGVVAFVAALVCGVSGTWLLLPLSAAYGLYTAGNWPYSVTGRPSPALRKELDHFVLLGAAGTIASTGLLQLSMIVAKATGGPEGAGQYAAAFVLATPASLLATSLSLVLFPSLAEAWGRGDRVSFRAQTDQATRILVVVMLTAFGSLILCSRLVIHLVWGKDFADAAEPFPILVLAVLVSTMGVAGSNALLTGWRKGVRVTTAASLSGLVIGALVWLVATPALGILGVALGYLCGAVVIGATPLAAIWRLDGHRWLGLAMRLGTGLLLLGGIYLAQRSLELGISWDLPAAALFCALWWMLSWKDVRVVVARGAKR
ncbi:MAG: lipopolysaccharide biosynthesis protein [Pedococcus sp.]